MEVFAIAVEAENLRDKIQEEKDKGRRILALAPSKIIKGVVKIYVLVTQ